MRVHLASVASLVAFAIAAVSVPCAADSREDARTAYAAASHAFDAGDFVTAARELTRADELVRNDAVLELALDAVVKTDLAALGMELADRADRTPALARKAAAVRAKFSEHVGRLRVRCAAPCEVTANGERMREGVVRWMAVGHYAVELRSGGRARTLDAEVRPSDATELEMPLDLVPPAPPPLPHPPVASGLGPVWFFTGVGLTAVMGAGAIGSGVDADSLHARYIASSPRTSDLRSSGIAAQNRTDVLAAVTAVVGLGALALGIWGTRWRAARTLALRGASLSFTFD